MVVLLTVGFSACGGKGTDEENTTTAVVNEFSMEKLGEAYTSGNGAVYEKFVNDLKFKKFNFVAIVDTVEGQMDIKCDAAYYDVYRNFYGLHVIEINLETTIEQEEILMTLKEGDKIEFVGTFDQVWIYGDYNTTTINFTDVIIKTVNGTAV